MEAAIEKALDKMDFRKRMATVKGPDDARLAQQPGAKPRPSAGKRS